MPQYRTSWSNGYKIKEDKYDSTHLKLSKHELVLETSIVKIIMQEGDRYEAPLYL